MTLVLRILRVLALLIAGCVAAVLLPAFPVNSKSLGDPANHLDSRITVEITDVDLKQILRVVRHGRLNSIYEIVLYHTRSPLIEIAQSQPSRVLYPGARDVTSEPAKGRVVATVGISCGPQCGSGATYYLDVKDGVWFVLQRSVWIA